MGSFPPGTDIVANITFFSARDGGRSPFPFDHVLTSLFEIGGAFYSCRICVLSKNEGRVAPGQQYAVGITFVDRGYALANLKVGSRFHLKELHRIAEGVVTDVSGAA
jgi:hypothetical protein